MSLKSIAHCSAHDSCIDPLQRDGPHAKAGIGIHGRVGSLEVTSYGVVYVEGPYAPGKIGDTVEKSKPLAAELTQIAEKIESIP